MNLEKAIKAFAALSQNTRLQVFRLLIEYGRSGAPAGVLSSKLGIAHNTLSFHLSHLSDAKLVTSRKKGRSVIYAANCDAIESLILYLKSNCCIREEGSASRCKTLCKPAMLRKT